MKKHTITITQEHINRAVQAEKNSWDICGICPITQAAREQLNDPLLHTTCNSIYNRQTHKSFSLPEAGKQIACTVSSLWHTLRPTSFEVKEEF